MIAEIRSCRWCTISPRRGFCDQPACLRIESEATCACISSVLHWAVLRRSTCESATIHIVTLIRRFSRFYLGTGIVPLETRLTTLIAELTLRILPSDTQVLSVVSDREGPTRTTELVQAVIGLVGNVGANAGIDPGRTKIAEFGHRLVESGDGDAPGTRTPNLVIKSHLLCQLS